LPNAAKRRKSGSPGRQPWFLIFKDRTSREAAAEGQICRPFGAVTYMVTHTQRWRAGLSSHAASRRWATVPDALGVAAAR